MPPKILLAVLNWGLGHATRCVPLVHALQCHTNNITLASDGIARSLLQEEFPGLEHVELPAYDIRYPGSNMVMGMLPQLPRIFSRIRAEHRVVEELVRSRAFTHLISDNRFGAYTKHARTAYLTHQVQIPTPVSMLSPPVNALNHRFIRRFDELWVPDRPPGSGSLAGPMSDGSRFGTKYLGCLSRMRYRELPKKYDLTAVVSGPEPQRSRFADKLHRQLAKFPGKTALVLGQPNSTTAPKTTGNLHIFPFLATEALNELLLRSRCVVSRSGYSSLMDYERTGTAAILIPTPGQTEQEQLAERLAAQQKFATGRQADFRLSELYPIALKRGGFGQVDSGAELLEKAVGNFLTATS